MAQETTLDGHRLHLAEALSRGLDFPQQTSLVLILLGLFLQKPGLDFRKGRKPGRIDADPHALAGVLVEEGNGVPSEVVDFHPVVARAAQSQKLHGIGQALAALDHGLEESVLREMALGQFDHIAAHKQAGGRVSVKILRKTFELLERIRTDMHMFLTVNDGKPGRWLPQEPCTPGGTASRRQAGHQKTGTPGSPDIPVS